MADRLPGLRVAGVVQPWQGRRTATPAWAGIYPTSPDGVPLVGPVPGHPSVILVAGAGGSGIQMSPIMGALAADWIAYGEPRSLSDGAALAPGRPSLADAAAHPSGGAPPPTPS
jgi:glycine/D-amino acid oxidase-like deaminating enzyme